MSRKSNVDVVRPYARAYKFEHGFSRFDGLTVKDLDAIALIAGHKEDRYIDTSYVLQAVSMLSTVNDKREGV